MIRLQLLVVLPYLLQIQFFSYNSTRSYMVTLFECDQKAVGLFAKWNPGYIHFKSITSTKDSALNIINVLHGT